MNEAAKRAFDVAFAVVFLIVFFPVYIFAAIGVAVCSPGTPIYKARRVGRDGKIFTCYKFRSMRLDSGKVKLTTLRNDDRIFAFGKFIRKTKIDETPQIFNILKGEMSVVGPRPEDEANAEKIYVGEYKRILDVKPGLTSPASLYDFTRGEKYESEEAYEREFLPRKLALELLYVERRSFWRDLWIVAKTGAIIVATVLGKRNFNEPKELAKSSLPVVKKVDQ